MSAPNLALEAGTVLDSFRVEEVLGRGAFGITYKATDLNLQRPVAVKEYYPTNLAARDDDTCTVSPRTEADHHAYSYGLKRFLDEARTLAMFDESSIVRVTRFMEANGTAYLVMDYEEGQSLAEILGARKRLSDRNVRALGAQVLRGLEKVHAKRFLHRDIKPANILIRKSGRPVLLDFGAARMAMENSDEDLTVMLTPGYAPIEQYSNKEKQGPWSDLYALGATLYHCVVGRQPMTATQRVAEIHSRGRDPILIGLGGMKGQVDLNLLKAIRWMTMPYAGERPKRARAVRALLMKGHEPDTESPATGSPVTAGLSTAGLSTSGPATARPATAADTHGQRPDLAIDTAPRLPDEVLERFESALAEHLGPIARMLVDDAAESASDLDALTRALLGELSTEDERAAFLDAIGRKQ